MAPDTLLGWVRADKKSGKKTPVKRGRRRTPEQIRRVLKKLGVRSISRNTVKRILKDAGYDPGPKRGEGSWDEFIKQHAASLWQCDFFSKHSLSLKGIREVFVLACLDRFVVFGEQHMDHVCQEYLAHYHEDPARSQKEAEPGRSYRP